MSTSTTTRTGHDLHNLGFGIWSRPQTAKKGCRCRECGGAGEVFVAMFGDPKYGLAGPYPCGCRRDG